jgi:hypothetical protein
MKATIKYLFIYTVLTIAGFFLLASICKLASMCISGYTFKPNDFMEDPLLYTIALMIGSQLLVMFVFWKRKYASYSFKFNYQFGENFSAKKLYLWAAVAAVGCLLFDCMLLEVFPIIDDWNVAIFGDIEPAENAILTDWRAWHEFIPFRGCLLPSIESYQVDDEIIIIYHNYSLEAYKEDAFSQNVFFK